VNQRARDFLQQLEYQPQQQQQQQQLGSEHVAAAAGQGAGVNLQQVRSPEVWMCRHL
jgi:hypothetical protein